MFFSLPNLARYILRTPLRWSLRAQMLALAVALLIPMVLVAYFLIQDRAVTAQQAVLDQSTGSASSIAFATDFYIGDTERLTRYLAEVPTIKSRDPNATNRLFSSLMTMYPNITNMFATDEEGNVFAGAVLDAGDAWNINDRGYYKQVMESGVPFVSGRVETYWRGVPCIILAAPIRDYSGTPIGIVGITLSLAELKGQYVDVGSRDSATVTLVDGAGQVVLAAGRDEQLAAESRSDLPIQTVMSGISGVTYYDNPRDKTKWLAAYSALKQLPWRVIVERRSDSAFKPASDSFLFGLLYMAIALAVASMMAVVLSSVFVRPLNRLATSLKQIPPTEDEAKHLPIGYGNEIESIAAAFKELSSNLSSATDELTIARAEVTSKAKELARLLEHMAHLQENERKRIALDIHDGAAQYISAALYDVVTCKQVLQVDTDAAMSRLERMSQLLDSGVGELRRVMLDLRPERTKGKGLVSAIRDYVEVYKVAYNFDWSVSFLGDECRLDPEKELAVFRIVQEALHNVRKHAGVTQATVSMRFSQDYLTIEVRDKGRGFDMSESRDACTFGLEGMRERADAIGATLWIESRVGLGTSVRLALPR